MEINYTLSARQFDQPNKGNGGHGTFKIQKAHSLYSGGLIYEYEAKL